MSSFDSMLCAVKGYVFVDEEGRTLHIVLCSLIN